MRILFLRAKSFSSAGLGRCPRCMRQSFIVALIAVSLALIITEAVRAPAFILLAWIIAGGLAILWLAHMSASALRGANFALTRESSQAEDNLRWAARRKFIVTFARVFLITATISAIPGYSARAQGCLCSEQDCNCDPGYFCVMNPYFPSDSFCCPDGTIPCSESTGTLCCDKGCYGEGCTEDAP